MNNLALDYTATDFNFTFAFDYLVSPLSSIEYYFYTFMINTLYVVIPGFELLNSKVTAPIIRNYIDRSFPLVLISMLIICLVLIDVIVMIIINYVKMNYNQKVLFIAKVWPTNEMKPGR